MCGASADWRCRSYPVPRHLVDDLVVIDLGVAQLASVECTPHLAAAWEGTLRAEDALPLRPQCDVVGAVPPVPHPLHLIDEQSLVCIHPVLAVRCFPDDHPADRAVSR